MTYAIPETVLRELRESKAIWRIEPGSKHGKLFINGAFCGIVSKGRGQVDQRTALNLRAQVRRALKK